MIPATIIALRASANINNEEILEHLKELQKGGHTAGLKLDTIHEQVEGCLQKIDALRKNISDIRTREEAILAWLHFRQNSWRYEDAPLAYQKTFKWIFENPASDDSWDNFSAHLGKNTNTPYFVNGKAGSGKSTLMKFIVEHPKTKEALLKWTGQGHRLLVVKFFFWNQGTPLQKSLIGMLRALLYSALMSYTELIPAVFPELYRNWKDGKSLSEPSYVEVKNAFEALATKSAKFLKLCVFIDGIDELEGDHRDTSVFLRSLASRYPHVKLIVSSRPITACLNTFGGCPTLTLQDLTKHDMEVFIQGNFASHQAMVELAKHCPEQAREIYIELKDKAEGVFLWVRLVVRILLSGLEEGDDIQDLQNKLQSLPPDLRDLYQRMLFNMIPEHRVQAAEIFQLIYMWKGTTLDPLTTTTLFFAVQPPSEAFTRPNEPLNSETMNWYHNQSVARIRSRCCGLLEVHKQVSGLSARYRQSGYSSNPNGMAVFAIDYLHRTVAEFLLAPDVWNEICETTKVSKFDPAIHLASACLSMNKIGGDCLTSCSHIAGFCQKATHASSEDLSKYMEAIDQAVNGPGRGALERQTTLSEPSTNRWSAQVFQVFFSGDTPNHQNLLQSTSIAIFAARAGLFRYLSASKLLQGTDSHIHRVELVEYALGTWEDNKLGRYQEVISLPDRRDTLHFLLQHVARLEDRGLRDSLLGCAMACLEILDHDSEDYAVLLSILLTTARSPMALIRTWRNPAGDAPLMKVASSLQCNDDLANRNLGYRMEQLIKETESEDVIVGQLTQQKAQLTQQEAQLIQEMEPTYDIMQPTPQLKRKAESAYDLTQQRDQLVIEIEQLTKQRDQLIQQRDLFVREGDSDWIVL